MMLEDVRQIDELLNGYDYYADPAMHTYFQPIADELWLEIEQYASEENGYGKILAAHLKRTSEMAARFLHESLRFSHVASQNFYQACLFHDLGKIHPGFGPEIWDLPHRPSEAERAEKRRHCKRGVELLDIAIEVEVPSLADHPHIHAMRVIQMYHHERIDGSGEFGLTARDMPRALQAICLVDAYDGDLIMRPHQPGQRTSRETLDRLKSDPKYLGAFDPKLIARFVDFLRSYA